MEKRVCDIIADILVENDINDVFSVVGGGAMFLNDAFGFHDGLRVLYNQHEQACSMAAEGYVRASGKMAAVCVTTGPGGTNTLTGVLGAYQDNYPMIVISGQVRYETCVDSTGLDLRFMGEQEHRIVETVKPLTKYAVMVKNPEDIRYEVEKALFIANSGRKGPCWVDVPLNIQGTFIEKDTLRTFIPDEDKTEWDPSIFIEELSKAQRPVILAGSALRSTGCVERFRLLTSKLKIPVLAATYNADLFPWDHRYYLGNFGVIGGRAGNFIVQNADLVIGFGCRMAFRQIGFNYTAFSPDSKKMIIDIDPDELKKPTLNIDIPINEDIVDVIETLEDFEFTGYEDKNGWLEFCDMLKDRFPIYLDKFGESECVNPYYFIRELKKVIEKDAMIVLGNSSIAGHVLQMGIDYPEQRIINNMNCGSMGYDLPAVIGAVKAVDKEITLITGDGSIMMNLQELMTVVHNKLPLKIFICNNGGYRAIVRTQSNMFGGRFTGCSPQSGVGMPDFEKIAAAFGIPYQCIDKHENLKDELEKFYLTEGFAICEIIQDFDQIIEPRTMSRKLEDGTLVSPIIDDLYPLLQAEEYERYHNFKNNNDVMPGEKL